MLKRIVDFFDTRLALPEADPERTLQLAACALLFEMVKADFSISDNEMAAMRCAMISSSSSKVSDMGRDYASIWGRNAPFLIRCL